MNILGIIPARGGSKGISKKNIRLLGGKPLITWTIEAAQRSSLLTRTILSSDNPEIIEVAKRHGLEVPFIRPSKLARDSTPALPMIQHAVKYLEQHEGYVADYVVLLQPTSPLRTAGHIDAAVSKLIQADTDSIVSVMQTPHHYSPHTIMNMRDGLLTDFIPHDEMNNLRQNKPVFFARNGAIYAFTRRCLIEKNSIYGEKILPYVMSREESVDIDEPLDLEICEFLLERRMRDDVKKRGV